MKGVNKSFGGLKALNEVVFDAVVGETHAIIGPNGAGKSTFLNVCIGKLVPDTGTVMFDGQTMMTGKQPHQINQAGIVGFSDSRNFPRLDDLTKCHDFCVFEARWGVSV